jgi:hypothetical protein
MITIWMDDYFVVMAYVDQCCLDTFACLERRWMAFSFRAKRMF